MFVLYTLVNINWLNEIYLMKQIFYNLWYINPEMSLLENMYKIYDILISQLKILR